MVGRLDGTPLGDVGRAEGTLVGTPEGSSLGIEVGKVVGKADLTTTAVGGENTGAATVTFTSAVLKPTKVSVKLPLAVATVTRSCKTAADEFTLPVSFTCSAINWNDHSMSKLDVLVAMRRR